MKRRFLYVSALVLITVFLAGTGYRYLITEQPPIVGYDVGKIERGTLVSTVTATGALNPLVTVEVGSQVSGTISRLLADFNNPVRRGELIAEIDPALFEAQVAQAKANLKSAEAAVDKAEISIRDTQRQVDRLVKLEKKQLVSDSDVDAARFALEAAIVEKRVRAAAVAQSQAALIHARVNLANTSIKAPIDGIVISRDVDVGQTVAASLQAPTLFTIAQDLGRMQIEAEVDEAFIGNIREGQPVEFTVFAYPTRIFAGHVAQVRLKPNVEDNVVKYTSIIYVDNSDLALKPGMTATVEIEVERHDDVLKVPNAALRFIPELPPEQLDRIRGELKRGESVVWKADNDHLQPITVKTGLITEKESEVVSDQLIAGMAIALPPANSRNNERRRRRRFGLF